jgi:hypothetical protein
MFKIILIHNLFEFLKSCSRKLIIQSKKLDLKSLKRKKTSIFLTFYIVGINKIDSFFKWLVCSKKIKSADNYQELSLEKNLFLRS